MVCSWFGSVTLLLLVAISACAQTPQVGNKVGRSAQKCIEATNDQPDILDTKTFDSGQVDYKGISFSFSPKLANAVVAELRSAELLECSDDKSDYAHPEHPVFKFKGGYTASDLDWEPEILIYPVADYKKTFAIAYDSGKEPYVVKLLSDFKAFLAKPATSFQRFNGEIPYALFLDAHQIFQAKVHLVNFKNGKGIFYLTEWEQGLPSGITNDRLEYTFQGLTNDGEYLVTATFPVKAPFLPENFDEIKDRSFDFHPNDKVGEARYKRYVAQIVRKLESLPSKDFSVDLALFDELIKSLRVDYRK
ncbi:MAG TPA: hypothetical protein VEF04_07775 [Blastocatellia bacterium]|nr:hypothetical protein [Blastocatellia bacterium]